MIQVTVSGTPYDVDISPGGLDPRSPARRAAHDAIGARAAAEVFADLPCPAALKAALRRAPRGAVVTIDGRADVAAHELPWEGLPALVCRPDLMVVRLAAEPSTPATTDGSGAAGTGVMVVEWLDADSPSIAEECRLIETTYTDRDARVALMFEPSGDAWTQAAPTARLVHIAAGDLEVSVSDQATLVDDIAAPLTTGGIQLIVLNGCSTCDIGRALAERTGSVVVGWQYIVCDELAFDMARVLHDQLGRGASIADALEQHGAQQRRFGAQYPLVMPVVWTPDLARLKTQLFDAVTPGSEHVPIFEYRENHPHGGHGTGVRGGRNARVVALACKVSPTVCPALIRSGRFTFLERLHVEPLDGFEATVRVVIHCDTGSASSTWSQTLHLDGLVALPTGAIQFPAVQALIDERVDRRHINLTVRVEGPDQAVLVEETHATLFLGANEWLNTPLTRAYLPAFVLAHSNGVRTLLPTDRLLGYNAPAEGDDRAGGIDAQVAAIFDAIRDGAAIQYVPPPGVGISIPREALLDRDGREDTGNTLRGQRVRFPNEIARFRRGTCHDLALLLAACFEHIGLRPVLVLQPGHTLVGYWTSPGAHADWAADRRGGRGDDHPWVRTSKLEIVRLVQSDALRILEATDLTRPGICLNTCLAGGTRRLKHFPSTVIDVHMARAWVEPIRYETPSGADH